MDIPTPNRGRLCRLAAVITFGICTAYAQSPVSGNCAVTAVPTQARAEGLTEQMGDIVLDCSGANPGSVLAGNISVFLPVSISNRVNSNNQTTDAVLFVDYGSGFVPSGIPGLISNQIIAFNGVSFTIPPSGRIKLKLSNIRAAVYQLAAGIPQRVPAQLTFSSPTSTLVNQSLPTVAFVQPGLLVALSDRGNITCSGSALPSTVNLSNLFETSTAFASTRVTEGFASAFQPRGPGEDNGTRFLVKYTGFPANAHIYVPDFVAGSTAAAPTSGGDLGVPQQVGGYVPGSNTLLLARVQFAEATGAGGFVSSTPTGSGVVALNSVSEVQLVNGSGYAVYEVMDSNFSAQESAQFPAFFGISEVTAPAVAHETVSFAPVTTVLSASTGAPVPRFAATTPGSDCSMLNDCNASYYPRLSVLYNPIQLTGFAGGAMSSQPGYIPISNAGGGVMPWNAIVSYTDGSGWLTLDYTSGVNNGAVRTWAKTLGFPANTSGTYRATVTINAGLAGSVNVPVTLTVVPAPNTPPGPGAPTTGPSTPTGTPVTTPPAASAVTVKQVINAASFKVTPLVPGSLGTLMGANFAGKSVSVTFDDLPATLLYTGVDQINLQVPQGLGSKSSAQMVVTVDGNRSAPYTVALAPAWPSVFDNGVLNQDNAVNASDRAAKTGSILQIYATGIPTDATVSVLIGDRRDLVPLYAGAAPDVPGVQQVNVAIPNDLVGSSVALAICATTGSQQYCSTSYSLAIQ